MVFIKIASGALSLMAFATFAAAQASGGVNYFVSPSGSDSNPCTQNSPCATPDYAVNNKAAAGDTVQVAAGTYDYGSCGGTFYEVGNCG